MISLTEEAQKLIAGLWSSFVNILIVRINIIDLSGNPHTSLKLASLDHSQMFTPDTSFPTKVLTFVEQVYNV